MTSVMSVEKALLYEKYRLPYAHQAVDDLLKNTGGVQVVADIGAGTGQLARLFAGKCARIYAIEPDPAMRDVASRSLAHLGTIEILDSSAERTMLAESCIDLIVIGNAFHRFRPEACDELRRILKKSGSIALFSYAFSNQAFTEMLFNRLAALKDLAGKQEESWHRTPMEDLFGDAQIRLLSYRQSQVEDWKAFFGAACAGIEAPERTDREFIEFEAINRQVFEAFAVNGKIRMDYETCVAFGQPLMQTCL